MAEVKTVNRAPKSPVPEESAIIPGSQQDPLAILKALTEASAVFIALTFVGGWAYMAAYYTNFGLNPLELSVPIAVVSTTAVFVMYQSVWPLFVAAVVIVLLAAGSRVFKALPRGWVVASIGVLLLTAASAGVFRGRRVASQDRLESTSTLPSVSFAAKSNLEPPFPSCLGYQRFGAMDCKLLMHSGGIYYFFQPLSRAGGENLNVFELPDSDLIGVHLQRGLEDAEKVQ